MQPEPLRRHGGETWRQKGIGTLLLGPIGLFGAGNAKTRLVDSRELYLLVEGPNWAYTQAFQPDMGELLRAFAQKINVVGKQHAKTLGAKADEVAATASPNLAGELRELVKLKDEGALTEAEFSSAKSKLLES